MDVRADAHGRWRAVQWQFEPSMKERGPVEVMQEVTIEFKP